MTQQGHHLGLHIGGKAGVRQRFYIHRCNMLGCLDQHALFDFFYLGTGFLQFGNNGVQVGRDNILHQYLPSGDGSGNHIGAGFDPIRYYGIASRCKGRYAFYFNNIRTRATDTSSHGVDEVG